MSNFITIRSGFVDCISKTFWCVFFGSQCMLSQYRPISVTPILSRIAEKLFVRHILLPVITRSHVDDQFGFIPLHW